MCLVSATTPQFAFDLKELPTAAGCSAVVDGTVVVSISIQGCLNLCLYSASAVACLCSAYCEYVDTSAATTAVQHGLSKAGGSRHIVTGPSQHIVHGVAPLRLLLGSALVFRGV